MRKNIDLSEDAVKAITIQAVKEGTVFKLKAEKILEDYAKIIESCKNQEPIKRFSTMEAAVEYLDKEYTRKGWRDDEPREEIDINGIRTIVMYGLRVDPCSDEEYEYVDELFEKYPDYNIRLS